ncbi:MAG TPA: L-histidine N(alpha)-methyltransferase [Candidatus Eisenbacteria bacterium]|nr:L-histidine N(alpha)-methyltransferase [Candidatus Eisenbacteria bacterium]
MTFERNASARATLANGVAAGVPAAFDPAFAADVAAGLAARPRRLSARWLYDAVGAALFDAITWLPEYGLTAADERVLAACAGELARRVPGRVRVAELGSGSGRKTPFVLEPFAARATLAYHPIDLAAASLARCARDLAAERVRVLPVEADYLAGLEQVCARRRPGERLLVLFLGSSIGNFTREEGERFLAAVRLKLDPGDALLLGTDLEHRPERLIPAYDDAAGVTAAFDRNALARINRELAGDFDVAAFAHEARWNAAERRIEMHLRARTAQRARIGALSLEVRFAAGETLWTEGSHKYEAHEAIALGARAGFAHVAQWRDARWPFAETLFRV